MFHSSASCQAHLWEIALYLKTRSFCTSTGSSLEDEIEEPCQGSKILSSVTRLISILRVAMHWKKYILADLCKTAETAYKGDEWMLIAKGSCSWGTHLFVAVQDCWIISAVHCEQLPHEKGLLPLFTEHVFPIYHHAYKHQNPEFLFKERFC